MDVAKGGKNDWKLLTAAVILKGGFMKLLFCRKTWVGLKTCYLCMQARSTFYTTTITILKAIIKNIYD